MPADKLWDPEDGFGSSGRNESFPERPQYGADTAKWLPPIDVYETGTSVVVVAELPGVEKDDIKVCFNDDLLTISGVKKKEASVKGCSFFCVERYYGSFRRYFRVVVDVDKQNIAATFDSGVLTIIIPKLAGKEKE